MSFFPINYDEYFKFNLFVYFRNEEDKYLDFLSKVTEDILRSGVFSDKYVFFLYVFNN